MNLWKSISQTFVRGFFLLLPLLLSFYFLVWLINLFDGLFNRLLSPFLHQREIPFGVGIVMGITFIFLVGMTSRFSIARFLENWLEKAFKKIPIVGTVFNSLKDIAEYAKSMKNPNAHGKSVIVTFPNSDTKIAGFLTRTSLDDLPTNDDLKDRVAVYIPLAYMVGGGFTIFVKKEQVCDLDIPFERAMQLNLTAWMASQPTIK
ncbi:MAG: DUF502 domain-containing protein [Proteobacteria bacterium]|jgi:uncharacterized membrane protein|nr:DUF502 domain-containing protein [Pseudomonadota bacterium]